MLKVKVFNYITASVDSNGYWNGVNTTDINKELNNFCSTHNVINIQATPLPYDYTCYDYRGRRCMMSYTVVYKD